jgi:hypothetical protein
LPTDPFRRQRQSMPAGIEDAEAPSSYAPSPCG